MLLFGATLLGVSVVSVILRKPFRRIADLARRRGAAPGPPPDRMPPSGPGGEGEVQAASRQG